MAGFDFEEESDDDSGLIDTEEGGDNKKKSVQGENGILHTHHPRILRRPRVSNQISRSAVFDESGERRSRFHQAC